MTPAELLQPSSLRPVFEGAFIEEWKQHPTPSLITKQHCPALFQEQLAEFEKALVLPVFLDGSVERWIIVLDAQKDFADIDLMKLTLLGNFTVNSLVRSEEKRQLQRAQQWIDWELSEIARLQHLMLPEGDVEIPGINIAFKFKTYKDAGGDYFDIMSLDEDREGLHPHRFGAVIADVTGHGPSAAVEAAMLDAIFRTYKPEDGGTPAEVLNYINDHFFTRKSRGKFITAKVFSYEPPERLLKFASAGHPHAYIVRANGDVECLDESEGIPLGVLKGYRWSCHETRINKGDILFMYTDVVLETRDEDRQEFGFSGLEELLAATAQCPFQIVDAVETALMSFSGQQNLDDDLTLCAVQFTH